MKACVVFLAISAAAVPLATVHAQTAEAPMTAANGLIVQPSAFGPKETMDRLAAAVTSAGMTVMARIDHAAAAETVGLALRPTEVLVFGNPKAGTPLMQAVPTLAIDLPLKALVWQDDAGKTWLAWNDPAWIKNRHGGTAAMDGTLAAMSAALATAAGRATTP